MSDTNLDTSIISVTNRAVADASTASPRELLNISRIGPSLEQSENANLEITLNARALDLAPSATANELRSLGMAIGNMLEPQTERIFMDWRHGFIPDQRFADGQFLRTAGSHQKSWGGVTTTTLDELQLTSVATGESLVYNSVSGKFENSTNTFSVSVYASTGDLPAAPSTGSLAYVTDASDVYYYTGSEWMLVSDVYSGIYRGNWNTPTNTWMVQGRVASPTNSGYVLDLDSAPVTGTRWDGTLSEQGRVASPTTSGYVLDVDDAPVTGTRWDGSLSEQGRVASPTTSGYVIEEPNRIINWYTYPSYTIVDKTDGIAFGTGDFTVEFWVNPQDFGGFFQMVDDTYAADWANAHPITPSPTALAMGINTQDKWVLRTATNVDASAQNDLLSGNTAYLADEAGSATGYNQWSHIAIVRASGVTKVYLNGTSIGSFSDTASYDNQNLILGNWWNGEYALGTANGANDGTSNVSGMFDFRIVKGTAVYTTNFTPPTTELESISGTTVHLGPLSTTGHSIATGEKLSSFNSIRHLLSDADSGLNRGVILPF